MQPSCVEWEPLGVSWLFENHVSMTTAQPRKCSTGTIIFELLCAVAHLTHNPWISKAYLLAQSTAFNNVLLLIGTIPKLVVHMI